MSYFVVFVFWALALQAGSSDGARGVRFPECPVSSKEVQAEETPRGSCGILRDDCRSIWLGLGQMAGEVAITRPSQYLVTVQLGLYQYQNQSRKHGLRSYPNPTVLLSKINCQTDLILSMRLTVRETNISSCIKFRFFSPDHNCLSEKDFVYDCRWFTSQYNYIDSPMTLEYVASNGHWAEYKQYFFRLPPNGTADREETDFNDFQLLLYREDEDCPPCAHFRWPKPPERFKVTKYRVSLQKANDNVSKPVTFYRDEPDANICSVPETGVSYVLIVEPCRDCTGNVCSCGAPSVSEPFYTNTSNTQLIIYIVLCTSAITFALIRIGWNLVRMYAGKRKSKFEKCILVFEPSCKSHVILVSKLVRFLQRSFKVPVLFGETGIQNENATDWYSKNLKEADLVLIVSNPTPYSAEDVATASIFYPVYANGCVKEFVRDIINSSKKFIRILLPYCTEDEFYEFTHTKTCYNLKKEAHRLLKDVLGPTLWLPPFMAWGFFKTYFDSPEWRDLTRAMKKYPNISMKPLRDEYDYDTSSQSISDEEAMPMDPIPMDPIPMDPIPMDAIPMDVMPRIQKLQEYEDEDSSGSESELQPHQSMEAVSQNSVEVAIDNIVDAQFNNV